MNFLSGGHEAAATVVAAGEGVTTVAEGDRVVCHRRKGAGAQAPTASHRSETFGRVNSGWVTTFSEYFVVSENRVTPVPTGFDAEVATLFGCAITTAMGVINNDARLGVSQSIAVFGSGGVGMSIVQFASLVAGYLVIAIDVNPTMLGLARDMGATHVIDSTTTDPLKAIREIVGPQGVDVCIETTGVTDVNELAYEVISPHGRVGLVGVPRKAAQRPSLYMLPLHFDKVLTGSEGGSSHPDVDIPRLVPLSEAGRLSLDGLISVRYDLAGINDAIADLRAGEFPGCCIVWMEDRPS